MKAKKVLSSLVAGIMTMWVLLAGCGTRQEAGKPQDSTAASTAKTQDSTAETKQKGWKLGSEPLKFTFYVNYDWYAPKGFGSTQATKWLTEKMNVTVEEISSNGNSAQKFGAMVASNDLPDVIQMDRGTQLESLFKSGKLKALDEYISNPEYPNYKKTTDPEAVNLTRIDGKIPGMLNWYGTKEQVTPSTNNKGWIVNKKIYKALGSPKLETFEELYSYLKQVKEKYPDVVPLDTSNTNGGVVQVQNFLYVGAAENHWIDWGKSDGTFAVADLQKKEYTSIFDDPALKESYKWTSKFFREKLLTQDAFTQKMEQFKEKLNNGKIAVAAFYDVPRHGEEANNVLKPKDAEAGYDFIPYIHKQGVNADKILLEAWGDVGWNINCITTKAKEPEKIYAFFDWMCSEDGVRFMAYGPKGELWDNIGNNGAPVPNEKYNKMPTDERNALKIGDWLPQGSWVNGKISYARNSLDPSKKTWGDNASEFYGKWTKVLGNELEGVSNYPANSEEDLAWKNIKQINEQYVAKVVFAKSDAEIDSLFDAWKKAVYDAGYEKILKFRNSVWKENLKKIGG